MAFESETVETLEAAALQLTRADRARLIDRLPRSMLIPKSKKLGQRKSSADEPK